MQTTLSIVLVGLSLGLSPSLSPPSAVAGTLEPAAVLNNQAAALADEERYIEAETRYRAAIRLIEQEHGVGAPALAQPLNNLAIVHRRLGRLRDAERGYLRSLAIREGADDASGASLVRVNLARLYMQQGRRVEAERMLDEADRDGAVRAASLHTRGALLLHAGRFGQAADCAEAARQAWGKRGRTLEAAQARGMRGEALRLAGRFVEAHVELAGALRDLRAVLGGSHPEVGRVLIAYGEALRAAGEKRRGRRLRADGRAILAAAPDRVAREHIVEVRAGYTRSR